MAEKRPGQPTKYKPEFCTLLVEHMERGGTFEGFAGHPLVRVSKDTLYEWANTHPEFSEARALAKAASQYHWDEIGATNVHTPPGQWSQQTWMFIQRTRFGQRDGTEASSKEIKITQTADTEKLENVTKQLAALIASNAKRENAKTEPCDTSRDDHHRAETNSKADGPNSDTNKEEK